MIFLWQESVGMRYNNSMFTRYVEHIMRTVARYERLPEGKYYGSIKGFQGVWSQGATKKECTVQLREVLEEWLLLQIRKNRFVPTTKKYDLNALLSA